MDIHDPEAIQRLEKAVESINRAVNAAYTGSSEHGSFFRGARGEYTPNVFILMNELEDAAGALKK